MNRSPDALHYLHSLSPQDLLARALQGEAGSQGHRGMTAAGAVMMNRLANPSYKGDTVHDILLAPGQFSMFNNATGYAGGEQGSSAWHQGAGPEAMQVAGNLLSGNYQDETGGATHYYNPAISDPAWGRGRSGVMIGDHKFLKTGGGSSPDPEYDSQLRGFADMREKSANGHLKLSSVLYEDMIASDSELYAMVFPDINRPQDDLRYASLATDPNEDPRSSRTSPRAVNEEIPPEVANRATQQPTAPEAGPNFVDPQAQTPQMPDARASATARQALPDQRQAWFDRDKANQYAWGQALINIGNKNPRSVAGAYQEFYDMQNTQRLNAMGVPADIATDVERTAAQLMQQHPRLNYEQALAASMQLLRPAQVASAQNRGGRNPSAFEIKFSAYQKAYPDETDAQILERMEGEVAEGAKKSAYETKVEIFKNAYPNKTDAEILKLIEGDGSQTNREVVTDALANDPANANLSPTELQQKVTRVLNAGSGAADKQSVFQEKLGAIKEAYPNETDDFHVRMALGEDPIGDGPTDLSDESIEVQRLAAELKVNKLRRDLENGVEGVTLNDVVAAKSDLETINRALDRKDATSGSFQNRMWTAVDQNPANDHMSDSEKAVLSQYMSDPAGYPATPDAERALRDLVATTTGLPSSITDNMPYNALQTALNEYNTIISTGAATRAADVSSGKKLASTMRDNPERAAAYERGQAVGEAFDKNTKLAQTAQSITAANDTLRELDPTGKYQVSADTLGQFDEMLKLASTEQDRVRENQKGKDFGAALHKSILSTPDMPDGLKAALSQVAMATMQNHTSAGAGADQAIGLFQQYNQEPNADMQTTMWLANEATAEEITEYYKTLDTKLAGSLQNKLTADRAKATGQYVDRIANDAYSFSKSAAQRSIVGNLLQSGTPTGSWYEWSAPFKRMVRSALPNYANYESLNEQGLIEAFAAQGFPALSADISGALSDAEGRRIDSGNTTLGKDPLVGRALNQVDRMKQGYGTAKANFVTKLFSSQLQNGKVPSQGELEEAWQAELDKPPAQRSIMVPSASEFVPDNADTAVELMQAGILKPGDVYINSSGVIVPLAPLE